MTSWKIISSFKLSGEHEETYVLARVVDTDTYVMVDIRRFEKGRPTREGVALHPVESIYMARKIQTGVAGTLEREHRKIALKFTDTGALFSVEKADGVKSIELSPDEFKKLQSSLNTLMMKLKTHSKERGVAVGYKTHEYFREY
jgi:hypothetical protein